MKTVFKIFGMTEVNVVNSVSLSSTGLSVEEDFNRIMFEAMEFNGFDNEFNSELEALEQLKEMEVDGFFTNSAWLGFEIKKVFVKD